MGISPAQIPSKNKIRPRSIFHSPPCRVSDSYKDGFVRLGFVIVYFPGPSFPGLITGLFSRRYKRDETGKCSGKIFHGFRIFLLSTTQQRIHPLVHRDSCRIFIEKI